MVSRFWLVFSLGLLGVGWIIVQGQKDIRAQKERLAALALEKRLSENQRRASAGIPQTEERLLSADPAGAVPGHTVGSLDDGPPESGVLEYAGSIGHELGRIVVDAIGQGSGIGVDSGNRGGGGFELGTFLEQVLDRGFSEVEGETEAERIDRIQANELATRRVMALFPRALRLNALASGQDVSAPAVEAAVLGSIYAEILELDESSETAMVAVLGDGRQALKSVESIDENTEVRLRGELERALGTAQNSALEALLGERLLDELFRSPLPGPVGGVLYPPESDESGDDR